MDNYTKDNLNSTTQSAEGQMGSVENEVNTTTTQTTTVEHPENTMDRKDDHRDEWNNDHHDNWKDKAEHAMHVAKEKTTEAANTAKEKATEMGHTIQEKAQQGKDRLKEMMD